MPKYKVTMKKEETWERVVAAVSRDAAENIVKGIEGKTVNITKITRVPDDTPTGHSS